MLEYVYVGKCIYDACIDNKMALLRLVMLQLQQARWNLNTLLRLVMLQLQQARWNLNSFNWKLKAKDTD